jgi:phosphate starvation-inducible protein PhoH
MAAKKTQRINEYGEPPKTLDGHPFYGLELDEQQRIFAEAIWNPDNLIVFANACAGSGKTTIAVGVADMLVQYGLYDGIVYVISPVQEEKSGFLPGDADAKTQVYTAPLYDALAKLEINPFTAIKQESITNQKNGTGYIDCVSHLWLRGCNLENKVVIVEESQNFYTDELKKVLTRIADSSKTIVIGHTGQCDLYHYPERSGFAPYIEHYRNEPYAQICTLTTNYRGKVSTHADEL